jgi:pimeloyl-ACP methyl ester carboxylesterase
MRLPIVLKLLISCVVVSALVIPLITSIGHAHVVHASGGITFDNSPGSDAPPPTLGAYSMTPFLADLQPFGNVSSVATPSNGDITFMPSLNHLQIGQGWATWSNGYTGDVYSTNGGTSAIMTLPLGTSAFYFYAEPNPFAEFYITATTQNGTSSGPIPVNGFHGANYFGFYTDGSTTLETISVSSNADFAIGEFGISTAAAPKRPLIFVPGIAGSALVATVTNSHTYTNSTGSPNTTSYKAGDTAWINPTWALNPFQHENFDVLRFNQNGQPLFNDFGLACTNPQACPAQGTLTNFAGQGYPDVVNFFTSKGYELNKNFFIYPYDWRYDASAAAAGLNQLVGAVANGGQVDIIAHSMGTMVTRQFLLTGSNASAVHRVVFLAPPNLGTPKGALAAMAGVDLTKLFAFGIPQSVVKNIFETIPGGLDQAPSANYYSVYHGQDSQHPVPYIDFTKTPNKESYTDLRQAELDSGVYQSAISSDETFHNSDLGWPSQLSNTNISDFVGTGKCTVGQIQVKTHPSGPFNWFGSQVKYYDFGEINGDGTVTIGSASMNNGNAGGGSLVNHIYYRSAEHGQMGDDPSILTDALRVVLGDDTVDHGSPTSQPSSILGIGGCRTVSVHSPMEVLLTEPSGDRVGGLTPGDAFMEDPNSDFWRFGDMKVATVDPTTPFTATVHGTGNGDSMIKVRTWSDSGLDDETIFAHVPTTANTTGSFSFNGSSVSPLTVDVNGDGKNIVTIQPVALTGGALNDVIPPSVTINSPASGQSVVGTFPVSWTATDSESGVASSGATIDLGQSNQITLKQPRSVQVSVGNHTLDVGAEDRVENFGKTHATFQADGYSWLPPLQQGFSGNVGQTIPVKFTVTTPGGAFVVDQSVILDLVDSSGNVVSKSMSYGTDPAQSVTITGNQYHGNLSTMGISPGSYVIRVRFSSSSLVGTLTLPITLK